MKRLCILVLAVIFVPLAANAGTLNYVGSSTVGKFISDAAKVYKQSDFVLDTAPESGGGEKAAAKGTCDLCGVARDVNQKYLDQGVAATLIGKDAIAAIVNKDNPVSELTSAQLKGIFTGKITNWKEVGGPDMAISAYIVKKGSATRKVFGKAILGSDDYAGVEVITPDAKIPTMVGREKGAIGQISFAFLTGKTDVKALTIDGQKATVQNPDYPVTRPLHIATKGMPVGEAKTFLDWALSPAGQDVVKQRFVGAK